MNNLLGCHALTREALQEFCASKRLSAPPGDSEMWDASYSPTAGFSDDLLDAWLKEDQHYELVKVEYTAGQCLPELLNTLASKHNCNALLCRRDSTNGGGHSLVLTRCPQDSSTWWLLDSLRSEPHLLTSERLEFLGVAAPPALLKLGRAPTPADKGGTRATCPPPTFYLEKQEKHFCLVHALNMATHSAPAPRSCSTWMA